MLEGNGSQTLADLSVVGYVLGDDVKRALQRLLRGVDLLLRVDEGCRHVDGVFPRFLRENGSRQRLQPLFTGNRGSGLALGLVGAVNVLDFGERGCLVQSGDNLVGQLACIFNGSKHLVPAFVQILKILIALGDFAQLLVVHGAVHLLAVACDKRNGIAVVDQLENILAVFGLNAEFGGKRLCKIHFLFLILCKIYLKLIV